MSKTPTDDITEDEPIDAIPASGSKRRRERSKCQIQCKKTKLVICVANVISVVTEIALAVHTLLAKIVVRHEVTLIVKQEGRYFSSIF